jgi:hypothetical protein
MIDPVELTLAISIFIAILALGAVIAIGNERVRRATLQVREVAHEYALADLAMRREQARRSISFATQAECVQALEQIALDASKERHEMTNITVAPGSVAALVASTRNGSLCILTPSAETFLTANPAYARRAVEQYAVNGLTSNPFVIAELEAIARWHGITALPRTEEWSLLVVPSEDYSLLARRGLSRFLRLKWS